MEEHVFSPEMKRQREHQLILALLDCAGSYYDINFTRNSVVDAVIQTADGVHHSIQEKAGLPQPTAYTDVVRYWGSRLEPSEQPAFFMFFELERIKARYAAGDRLLVHRCWHRKSQGELALVVLKIRLYEDCATGDLLGISYIYDEDDPAEIQKKQESMDAFIKEATHRISHFQQVAANLPGGYHRCSVEKGYPFLFISHSFETLVGYTREQIQNELDNQFINLVYPEDLPRFARLEQDILERGAAEVAYRIRRRDGQIRWVQDSSMVVDWEGVPCLQCTISDITDFVSQQEQYAKEKAELEELASSVPCGYHRCTTKDGFRLDFVSESFIQTVGYPREELIGMPFINMVHPDDRALFMSYEEQLVRDGYVELAYRVMRKDGQCRWIKDSTMRVEKGGRSYYQCILADITDFVRRQEEMVKENLKLTKSQSMKDVMETNMPSGYHRCAAERGCPFIYIGNHFTDIVGFTKEEIERDFDNCFSNLVWPEDTAAMRTYENMLEMRGHGNVYDTSVYRIRHKDGGYRWVTDSTMYVDLGEESFFQATIADITEYIESLNEARQRAEASSHAKSTFLFNASHDIRTPMNAIKGFAHIIEKNAGDEQVVLQTVRKIQAASDTLMSLLNDVLDLARIERGKEDLNLRPVSMHDQCSNLYEMFVSSMKDAGIAFRMESHILHPNILCDSLKVTRIGMNMLSNAHKFTPAGGTVVLGVEETACDEKTVSYRLYAKDTGIGMSEEFLKRAFEQFERERNSTQSGMTGTGLGLAIIKRLTELMGGEVYIRSELGKGTEIGACISFQRAEKEMLHETGANEKPVSLRGKRILLVEDNEFNREIARYILTDLGLEVEEAEDGLICLKKVMASQPGEYDLILMDIQMPVMDGLTAAIEIRSMSDQAKASIPMIAMTANAFDEDRQKCLEAGMNGHIGKPIEIPVLVQALSSVFQNGGGQG